MDLKTLASKWAFGRRKKANFDTERIENGEIIVQQTLPPRTEGVTLPLEQQEVPGSLPTALVADEADDVDGVDDVPQGRFDSVETSKRRRLPPTEQFWDHLETGKKGKRTIEEYRRELRWWQAKASAIGKTVYTLRVEDIEGAVKSLHPATLRRKVAFLRTFGRWLLRQGFARLHGEGSKVPTTKLSARLVREKGPVAFKELREQGRAWCAEGNRNGIWLSLMLCGGLRVSEIPTAEVTEVGTIRVIGKGDQQRELTVSGYITSAMQASPEKGKGGWRQERRVVAKCLSKQGITRLHGLRHTFAMEALRREVKIEEIQVLLGHSSIATTNLYARSRISTDVAALLDSEPEGEA